MEFCALALEKVNMKGAETMCGGEDSQQDYADSAFEVINSGHACAFFNLR